MENIFQSGRGGREGGFMAHPRLVVAKVLFHLFHPFQIDLGNIEEEFQAKYEHSLQDFIRDDTSGDFQKVLLSLCSPQDVQNDVNGNTSTA